MHSASRDAHLAPDARGRCAARCTATLRSRASSAAIETASGGTAGTAPRRTGTGCSSWRQTPPFRPSTSCCSTSWASATRPSKPRSRPICAACRVRTAGWALFHGGGFNISASVKAYLALKLAGDAPEAAHMLPGARGHSRPRRRRHEQRLHPHPARALWRDLLDGGADHSGRDRVPAAVVSVPPDACFVLEPDRPGSASGPAGAQAAGAQSARRDASTSSSRAAPARAPLGHRPASIARRASPPLPPSTRSCV